MKTSFSLAQLADPAIAEADTILRACVHCGFCTATCPTYVLLGDELDSPRGRIYLIKEMLETGAPATTEVVKHIDRCLSCLACMTTCPSGVHYMHLVDHARAHIEHTFRRPWQERILRAVLSFTLPSPSRFRLALRASSWLRPLARLLPSGPLSAPGLLSRARAMLELAPSGLPAAGAVAGTVFPAEGARRGRVALLQGCAQSVLSPDINAAAIRLLTRHGIEVVLCAEEQCCGALEHHLGREEAALAAARRNVDAWLKEADAHGLDAVLITASGCGTVVKDYGFMLRNDSAYAAKAARVSAMSLDVTEYVATLGLKEGSGPSLVVAYHSACSMQHGQKITQLPKELLTAAGFAVRDIPEGHLCCGSAGTYNIMQPGIASRLRDRKIDNIASVKPDIIATGNIGCMVQIASGTTTPIVHTIELIDWATGGPQPKAIAKQLAKVLD
jgi:glycolate oxidase iron-sulfur subunit